MTSASTFPPSWGRFFDLFQAIATKMECPPDVCFPPDSDRTADISERQLRANNELMHRNKPGVIRSPRRRSRGAPEELGG